MGGPGVGFISSVQCPTLFVRRPSCKVRICKVCMSAGEEKAPMYSRREAIIEVGRVVAFGVLSSQGSHVDTANAEENATINAAAASALVPLINLRMSLSQLGADIEGGTNGDLRRTIRTLQKGIDMVSSARRASSVAKLSKSDSENVRIHVREAAEFINQIVDYYEPTARNKRPPAEVLQFSLNALKSAADQLDQAMRVFSPDVVQKATEIVQEGGVV